MLLALYFFFLIQVLIWAFYFRRDLVSEKIRTEQVLPALSIIVCARNERENLRAHLPLWLAQKAVNFELIIVDDGSTDGSAKWLDQQAGLHPELRVIHVEKPQVYQGKRYALWKGIEAAQHSFVLLTDADCLPSSTQWASDMLSRAQKNTTDIVLGAAPLLPGRGVVNAFARYEALYTLMLYGSAAHHGQPYMGVGRNILYRKVALDLSVLQQPGKLSGDDDLMVNKIAEAENTTLHIHADSLCYSKAPDNWQAFLRQKIRHQSTASTYKLKHIAMLNVINGSRALFQALALYCLFWAPYTVLAMLVLRWLLIGYKIKELLSISRTHDLLLHLPFLDVGLTVYQFIIAPFIFLQPSRWK